MKNCAQSLLRGRRTRLYPFLSPSLQSISQVALPPPLPSLPLPSAPSFHSLNFYSNSISILLFYFFLSQLPTRNNCSVVSHEFKISITLPLPAGIGDAGHWRWRNEKAQRERLGGLTHKLGEFRRYVRGSVNAVLRQETCGGLSHVSTSARSPSHVSNNVNAT